MAISRSVVVDPARNFKFAVNVEGFTSAGFQKVSGLKETSEVILYREGTDPITDRKLPGMVKYENITLEKGITSATDFVDWRTDVVNIQASGNLGPDGVPDDTLRRDMEVVMTDYHANYQWVWEIYQAWPTELETNEMNAQANEVLIDKLVIAHEGFQRSKSTAGA